MPADQWQRRIERADELAARYAFAAEILGFYSAIARFQAKFYREIHSSKMLPAAPDPFSRSLDGELAKSFQSFLSVVEQCGPERLKEAARSLRADGGDVQFELLTVYWEGTESAQVGDPGDFFARAFLQPYAVAVREHGSLRWTGPTAYVCPFCKRKPGVGVLRPLGDGGQRSLVCSLCLGEWEFRRILCPGCGEADPAKLPVYTAEELQHVRVEACDSCQSYIKTVDLTKSGLGEPVVEEMAAVPLDLWAQQRGYTKLQVNLLQL